MTNIPSYSVGVDIGGTFTDVVFLDNATGELLFAKVSTTVDNRAEGFFTGILKGVSQSGHGPESVKNIFHGSTVATNAVLEGTGARMGLLTTEGFRDILEIGRAYIPGIFTNYMRWQKPERLVPLELVREIPERLAADGSIVRPLDEERTRELIANLLDEDLESLAISLIHSYANPDHEERLVQIVRELRPDLFVSRSSEVIPEYREYERTMTTVMNAYVMPVVARYLQRIQDRLEAGGFDAGIQIMRSDAGVMSLETTLERPVNTVLSGPAGGVKGASYLAAVAGYSNIVTMDMGGTSTDVCLSVDAAPTLSTDTWVSHYPVRVPIIDITTIGAGGGSIAFVSSAGALRVGPRSAGAQPGPVCYGRGGTQPTVTDANLILGRLPVELAGGEITLDVEASRQAVKEHIADPLGLTIEEAAAGIIRIVNENMLGALRVVSVQRGIDPRDLALVPFGGAGPVHGCELADLLGVETVLVPSAPGVLSALGFLLSDARNVFTRTRVGTVGELDTALYNEDLTSLIEQATEWLAAEGIPEEHREIEIALDMRYAGQAYELPIKVEAPLTEETWQAAPQRFHAEHQQLYGFDQPFARIEVVNLRVTAIGNLPKLHLEPQPEQGTDSSAARIDTRPVYFEDWQDTGIYDRDLMKPGNEVDGPAIVTQTDCTIVIPPGRKIRVDGFGNLVIRK